MARIEVFSDRVVIKLSAAERTLAVRRRDIVLSRERITSVLITDDPWVWLRGVRSPGAHLPTKLAIGTWRGFGGNDFCLIRSGRPAIVLDFDVPEEVGGRWIGEYDDYARVILSTEHAAELIEALRLDEGDADGSGALYKTDA
ncbi:MAG: hypothetical protein LCH36_10930 [Actinobacteria bacterium]|jgi:hypothetical protein|nr:hypothetical protein [Actinomycetota bacterium]